jgi:hypothetical protein
MKRSSEQQDDSLDCVYIYEMTDLENSDFLSGEFLRDRKEAAGV